MKCEVLRVDALGHSLYRVLVVMDEHDGNTWNFPDSPLQVLVASGHNEDSVLPHVVDQTVVCVGAFMHAGEFLEPRVFRQSDGHPVFMTELLELCDDAVCYVWNA